MRCFLHLWWRWWGREPCVYKQFWQVKCSLWDKTGSQNNCYPLFHHLVKHFLYIKTGRMKSIIMEEDGVFCDLVLLRTKHMTPHLEWKMLFLGWRNTFSRLKKYFFSGEKILFIGWKLFFQVRRTSYSSAKHTASPRHRRIGLCPHWGLRTPQNNQILFNQVKMEAWLHYRPWALPASIPTLYCHQLRRWEKQNYKITEIIRIMDAVSCQHSLQRQVSKISSYVAVSNSFSQNHRENALYLFFPCLCVYLCLSLSPSPHLSLSFPCSFKINSVTHSVSDRVNIT